MNADILNIINKKIPKYLKRCFASGMILGLITHFYMLTHKLPNWDDLNCISSYGSGDYLGRWFLKYIHPIGGADTIPALHGFLMIFFLTLSACVVMELLHLKSTTAAVLIPALMVTFPSVASTMTFMFMAHTSAMGIFMMCIGVYIARKYRFGWVPCIILLTCGMGVYQSYITIAITLILMGMIVDLLEEKEFKEVFKRGIFCALILVASVMIYMSLCHIVYPAIDSETYGGVGNMGNIPFSEIPRLIGRCYKRFLEFFLWKPFSFMTDIMQVCNIITCIVIVLLSVYLFIECKLYARKLEFAFYVVLLGLMPLATAFIYLMAPEVDYSMLMLYAYVLIYVLGIILWEKSMIGKKICEGKKAKNFFVYGISVVLVLTLAMSCYSNYLLTNKAYFRMELSKDRVTAYFNRILANLEGTPNYRFGDDVAILGNFNYIESPSFVEMDILDDEQLRTLSGVALENGLITPGSRDNFIRFYVGFPITEISDSRKEELMSTKQYKNMPIYPEEGSIQKIEDVWVVKLSNY